MKLSPARSCRRPALGILIPVVVLLSTLPCLRASTPDETGLADRALTTLRASMRQDIGSEKMHAAEALLTLGRIEGVESEFRAVAEAHGERPIVRIGLWRVLARSAADPMARVAWRARIEAAFLDSSATDRVWAIESLCKLGHVLEGRLLDAARTMSTLGTEAPGTVYALWALHLAGDKDAVGRIAEILSSSDGMARRRSSHSLGWLRPQDPHIRAKLARAADAEADDSAALPYVVGGAFSAAAQPERLEAWRSKLRAIMTTGSAAARYEACRNLLPVFTTGDLPQLAALLDDQEASARIGGAWAILTVLGRSAKPTTMRPHLLIAARANEGSPARSVEQLRRATTDDPHVSRMWKQLLAQVADDLASPLILPTTYRSVKRDENHLKIGNRDYMVTMAVGQRILRSALVHLVTGEPRYRDAAWRQIEALFKQTAWAEWRDQAHIPQEPADLRTGMLSNDLGLAYDWLHTALTPEQRTFFVRGIEERAIKPFWESVAKKRPWTEDGNNWTTNIVGGLGVLGMALAEDYPESGRLVEFSRPRMQRYLDRYGKEGEFNEAVGYSNATQHPTLYFGALRCATNGLENRLAEWPLAHAAIWSAQTYLPPNRIMGLGDSIPENPLEVSWFGPIASATRNRALQWFVQHSAVVPDGPPRELPAGGRECKLPHWLLGYDPTLTPQSPEGSLPHGRAYHEHGMIVSSRTDWNLTATACVVYGKAGIEWSHPHHDAGQVCIDGYGQRLIVDLGSPPTYPPDYVRNREGYYPSAWEGHNVLTLTDQPMPAPALPSKGRFLAADFDNRRGGYWRMDLTSFYPGAVRIVRTVVHLNAATVVVLDEADFSQETGLALRWHTVDRASPDTAGRFTVNQNGVQLTGRVNRIDGPAAVLGREEHAYRVPYNKSRYGHEFPQKNESFVIAKWRGKSSRVLSLFTAFPAGTPTASWEETKAGAEWQVAIPQGIVRVELSAGELRVSRPGTDLEWRASLLP